MSTRHLRFLQYKLVAPFSGSKGRRISEGILLTFPDTIGSPRESTLGCRTCGGLEREVPGFVGVGSVGAAFVGAVFRREPLGSRAGSRGSSPDRGCARGALGAGCWGRSPGSCG